MNYRKKKIVRFLKTFPKIGNLDKKTDFTKK